MDESRFDNPTRALANGVSRRGALKVFLGGPAAVDDEQWGTGRRAAVEIVSPRDRAAEIHAKTRDYLNAGTQIVWVLWPDARSVTVSDATGAGRELGPDGILDGGPLLPGLRVRVVDLFPPGN